MVSLITGRLSLDTIFTLLFCLFLTQLHSLSLLTFSPYVYLYVFLTYASFTLMII